VQFQPAAPPFYKNTPFPPKNQPPFVETPARAFSFPRRVPIAFPGFSPRIGGFAHKDFPLPP
jgi:hypothetical protein